MVSGFNLNNVPPEKYGMPTIVKVEEREIPPDKKRLVAVSLEKGQLDNIERLVKGRVFESRSHAVRALIREALIKRGTL